jgi:hypothetical protein
MTNDDPQEATVEDASADVASDKSETAGMVQGRSRIIDVVKTPLGFFVLVILVLETLFGVIIYSSNIHQEVRSGLLISTFAFILILVVLVAAMAIFKPQSLSATRSITVITSPRRSRSTSTIETIEKEEIYCASTPQWKQFAFEEDVKAIKKSFGKKVTVEYQLSSGVLGNLLTQKGFSIIHVVGHVDRNNGDMIFSEINLKTERPLSSQVDRIDADGFSSLVVNANVHLVVLATCYSLLLAVRLSRYTNVVSPNGYVEGRDVARWSEYFYRLLSQGKPLSKAHEDATRITNVPMYLIIKRDFLLKQ